MRTVDIIEKKRDGGKLSEEEIAFFVEGYSKGEIPDYQASALLMAILFVGMDKEEIAYLTKHMRDSGEKVDLSDVPGVKVDKHSTGGVGDKTSLVLGPLVASCGAVLAKMSGRGLGHTGGTLDKLESIPGMRINLSEDEFKQQVRRIGIAIIGQTADIDPADKKLYALRDVTGTVESIPLIASSIMSKKLCSGANAILLDVKFGSGAFMKTLESARELAKTMVDIGDSLSRDTRAIITDMDEPLGKAVGNALEVKEAIAALKGEGPEDLHELCVYAGGILLCQAKLASTLEEGKEKIEEALRSGKGLSKLREMVEAQGGDPTYIDDPRKFPLAKHIIPVRASRDGYIKRIDSLSIGVKAMQLGAGRATLEDKIDMAAGIVLCKKVGEYAKEGEVLAYAHTNKEGMDEAIKGIEHSFEYGEEEPSKRPIVYEYVK